MIVKSREYCKAKSLITSFYSYIFNPFDKTGVPYCQKRAEFPTTGMLLLKCCFTSTETVGLLGTGAQDVRLDFHTAPELWDREFCNGTIRKQHKPKLSDGTHSSKMHRPAVNLRSSSSQEAMTVIVLLSLPSRSIFIFVFITAAIICICIVLVRIHETHHSVWQWTIFELSHS